MKVQHQPGMLYESTIWSYEKATPYLGTITYETTLTLVFCTAAILFLRISIIGRGSPSFVDSDNPASFSPHLLTRFLTYSYLCAVNLWLLFCPSHLCFDWSMGSIPLVDTLSDLRNLVTVGGASLVAFLSVFGMLTTRYNRQHSDSTYSSPKSSSMTKNNVHCNGINTVTSHPISSHKKRHKRETAVTTSGRYAGVSLQERRKQLLLFPLALLILPFLPTSNLFFPVRFVVAEGPLPSQFGGVSPCSCWFQQPLWFTTNGLKMEDDSTCIWCYCSAAVFCQDIGA